MSATSRLRNTLLAFLTVVMTTLGLSAAVAGLGPANRIVWDGKGTTDGMLNVDGCGIDKAPYLDFNLTGSSLSNARISFDGGSTSTAMTKVKAGTNSSAFKSRYTPGAAIDISEILGDVVALYDGSKPTFVVGTGCLGEPAPADLVGYWNFNDSTRIGHPAIGGIELVARGDATYTATGARGGGLYLDGSGDFLSADVTFDNLPLGNSAYTIAAWIKPDEVRVSNFNGIVGWGDYGTGLKVNALRLNYKLLLNYWWGNDLQGGFVDTATFYHVCATYDGTTRALYVDGVLVNSQTVGATNNATANNFAIGLTAIAYQEYFHGTIDDVAIYKRALTVTEINTLKTSGP